MRRRGRGVRSGAESNRRPYGLSAREITEPLRPATSWCGGEMSRPPRSRTRTSEVGARRALRYTRGLRDASRERTTRLERASSEWRSGALPDELRPHRYARLDSNQRPLPSQDSARGPLSFGRSQEPPAGVEPAPRPYKGRVLAVDTTEACRISRWMMVRSSDRSGGTSAGEASSDRSLGSNRRRHIRSSRTICWRVLLEFSHSQVTAISCSWVDRPSRCSIC